jgi:hypothetical protein
LGGRPNKEKASAWWKKANAQCVAEAFRVARNTPSGIPLPHLLLSIESGKSARASDLNPKQTDFINTLKVRPGIFRAQNYFPKKHFTPCFYLTFTETR